MTTKKRKAHTGIGKDTASQTWTRNRGRQPVAEGAMVDVRYRSKKMRHHTGMASEFIWSIDRDNLDIMAWRLSEVKLVESANEKWTIISEEVPTISVSRGGHGTPNTRTISLPWPLRGWKLVRPERLQPTEHSGKVAK